MRTQYPLDHLFLPVATDCWFDPRTYGSFTIYQPPQVIVLILRLNASSPNRVQHRSYPLLHFVVLTRSSELSSVAGSSHVPSFMAPLWSASGHSLGNVFDVVSVRPFSVDGTAALSQSYGRVDRGKVRDSSTCVFLHSVVPSPPALFRGLQGCTPSLSGLARVYVTRGEVPALKATMKNGLLNRRGRAI